MLRSVALLIIFGLAADFAFGAQGKPFNPDLSLNGLFLYQNGTNGNNKLTTSSPVGAYENGMTLQEAELVLTSDVDTYAKFFGAFSASKENGNWKFEPEELYGESLNLDSFTIRAGKFLAAIGKYNQVHTHALPFINQNLINVQLFGNEGINSVGLGVSYLIPANWFSEVNFQWLSSADQSFFNNSSPNSSFGVARMRNLFDLNDDTTLELGISGTQGQNSVDKISQAGGADLTLKWRPSRGGKYSALIWSTEYLNGSFHGNPNSADTPLDVCTQGGSTFVQWQFSDRWWVQGRTEYLDQKIGGNYTVKKRSSLLLGFFPTEFSGFRLQYDYGIDPTYDKPDHKILLQANLTIGAHPAHSY